jgi:hypothetical protein
VPFPKWIYGPNGESKVVHSFEEMQSYPDWAETPAAFYKTSAPAGPATPVVVGGLVSGADTLLKRFYTVPVKVIADQVMGLPTLDEVLEVRDMEAQRPGGARKGVMQAVVARMEQLAPVPADAPVQ